VNSNNDDSSFAGVSLFGGAILVVAIGGIFLRHLEAMFEQVQKTFAAFGVMAHSAFGMLWWAGLVILTVAGIITAVVCAVYFAAKYIKLVRKATELQEAFATKTAELEASVKQSRTQIIDEVRSSIAWMNSRLEEALKEPEVAPEVAAASEASVAPEEAVEPSNSSVNKDSEGEPHEGNQTQPVPMNQF